MTTQPAISEEAEAEREHRSWLEDYRRWRAEHRQVLTLLAKLQATILEHEAELETHAVQTHAHERHLQEYDALQCESGYQDSDQLAAEHTECARIHRQAQEEHERMMECHVRVLALADRLLRAGDSAI